MKQASIDAAVKKGFLAMEAWLDGKMAEALTPRCPYRLEVLRRAWNSGAAAFKAIHGLGPSKCVAPPP